uniref:NADH-ubiquinone oxidoreductase chain 4L n=1 Tax=Coralliophila richardi TaxID=2991502 RepID=A0A9E8JYM9_9CAEN|nr:NADH dehydrogenase subunit 4L [Coralliophila richardi]UZT26955.1 NADH dehydrogenase subunit 4L [Coralliophila richardi]
MSTFYLKFFAVFGAFSGLLTLSLQHKHLLGVLISLETITMSLFMLTLCVSNDVALSGHSSLILITLGACEASLGLSVLVSMIRSKGNDYVLSFSSQKC